MSSIRLRQNWGPVLKYKIVGLVLGKALTPYKFRIPGYISRSDGRDWPEITFSAVQCSSESFGALDWDVNETGKLALPNFPVISVSSLASPRGFEPLTPACKAGGAANEINRLLEITADSGRFMTQNTRIDTKKRPFEGPGILADI
jgi:hypothetical protein